MAKIPFNVSARTARLIGRENVSNLGGALTELIKNTYDADASVCILYYEKTTNSLVIADNGIGMTEKIVIDNWMTIGNSTKTTNFKTISGRIKTGEKGIGRFALDRISSNCIMHTISEDSNFQWTLNWDDFGENALITETYAELNSSNESLCSFLKFVKNSNVIKLVNRELKNTGTCFRLTGLRDEWNSGIIVHIRNTLSKLLPPDNRNGFKLYFFEESSTMKESIIKSAFLDTYDYKINFELYNNNQCTVTINRNEFDFGNKFEKIMNDAFFTNEDRNYFKGKPIIINTNLKKLLPGADNIDNLGEISGDIYFYKLRYQEKYADRYFYKEFTSRKANFKEISGIKIYRDNFIVRPYGFYDTSGYDWLNLSTRKAESPAAISHKSGSWRVQANQMCGQVFISRLNRALPDKSSREGIVETSEFILFREFITKIISYFEYDRQYVIRKLDTYQKKVAEGEKALELAKLALEKLERKDANNDTRNNEKNNEYNNNYSEQKDEKETYNNFKKAIEYQEERIESLETEMGLLRTLATTGVVVNTYIHEIKALTTKMNMGIKEAYELLQEDNNQDGAIKELKKLRKLRKDFTSWFKVTLDSVKKDKRKRKKINLYELIENTILMWRDAQKDIIEYKVIKQAEVTLRCFAFDFESIINNLVTNSFSAFKIAGIQAPKIKISLGYNSEYNYIKYEDNGPGLSEAFKENPDEILEQNVTDRRNGNNELIGTGMGLWIVKNIIQEYNGYIDLSSNSTLKEGFQIILYFKGGQKN
ncbi:sensor histidine kinase [Vallitalea guaymasensis]|uniref:histidine kinase n=1 Tax=Vallitalea guaymasensis TaxID=1185412 RepID=A0A8J8SBW6_9FIRM|nr:sensor histidine kinase [Vallitalea guaymasensis]QUH28825.1 sensor histidine kinase [Vallitalea guaymasensis]